MKVSKGSQLFIHTADEAGELAKVLQIVADAGVNGIAYAGYSEGGMGRVMLVTEDNAKLYPMFKDAGYEVREEAVVLVTDKDAKGSALSIAQKLADAGINLTGAYATSGGEEYVTVLQAADLDALVGALQ